MWHPLHLGCICCCLKETTVIGNNHIFHVLNLSVMGGGHWDLRCCGVDGFFDAVMR